MSADPTNLLPLDPAWAKRVDELTVQAAAELKCVVLLVAIQEDGKVVAGLEGVPASGPLAELATDIPALLLGIANVVATQEEMARARPMQ